ncbi:MAG: SIR2 family protein [Chloroflexota bacterium]
MKTVYVLGAGATRAVAPNMPLTVNLLPKILESAGQEICWFLNDFYQASTPEDLPPLEDVLTQIDFAINENRPLSPKYTVQYMRTLRENLIFNICDIIRGGKDINFEAAVAQMESFILSLPEDDSIISLNYDLVADTAIRLAAGWKYVNYGFPVRQAVSHQQNKPDQITEYSPITLYKLHGSLNWLFCPLCRAVDTIDGHLSGEHYIYDEAKKKVERCTTCDVVYEPVIITPSFLKSYENLYVSYMWRQAENQLAQADNIVFIGYSLPDADMILRCMFRRAYFTHTQFTGKQSGIHIIDYDPNYDPLKPNDVFGRYNHLFGEITYDSRGFNQYITECKTRYDAARN